MNLTVHSLNDRLVAELLSDNVVICQVDDAIDLLGDASYLGVIVIVIRESNKAGHVVFVSPMEEVQSKLKK
jgi:hypothetical protein